MIFGRKNRADLSDEAADAADLDVTEFDDDSEASEDSSDGEAGDEADTADPGDEDEDSEPVDYRAEGPFDATEVDLTGDNVIRLPLGPLTITPFDGMGVQFQGDPETQTIYSALVMHENSGLQLELFAAPTSGGLATELSEDALEEAQQAGGNAEVQDGPFGPEIKRVLPFEGPEGEQLFMVSRVWLVDGPRWLLRGTLVGQAALVDGEESPADLFAEFFRNVVVHRDDSPRVPGELLTLALPEQAEPSAPQG